MLVIQDASERTVRINGGIRQGISSGQKVVFFGSTDRSAGNVPGKASEPKAEGIVREVYDNESIVEIIWRNLINVPEPSWMNIPPLNRPDFYEQVYDFVKIGDIAKIKE